MAGKNKSESTNNKKEHRAEKYGPTRARNEREMRVFVSEQLLLLTIGCLFTGSWSAAKLFSENVFGQNEFLNSQEVDSGMYMSNMDSDSVFLEEQVRVRDCEYFSSLCVSFLLVLAWVDIHLITALICLQCVLDSKESPKGAPSTCSKPLQEVGAGCEDELAPTKPGDIGLCPESKNGTCCMCPADSSMTTVQDNWKSTVPL